MSIQSLFKRASFYVIIRRYLKTIHMKKLITSLLIAITIAIGGQQLIRNQHISNFAYAEDDGGRHQTVLPEASENTNCKDVMKTVNKNLNKAKHNIQNGDNDLLACAIKTGDIKLFMIPYFIKYVLEFIIYIVGFLSILGIIYGGYNYLFAGLSEDKDSGKNAIKNSLIGLVLSLLAWPIVNIVLALLT